MSEDKKSAIKENKDKFLDEISQDEKDLLDDAAGGAVEPEGVNVGCLNISCASQ